MPKGIYKHKGVKGRHWKVKDTSKMKCSHAPYKHHPNQGFQKGHKDLGTSESHKRQGGKINGKNHYGWKGNNVGYYGIHSWIEKWKGLPRKCEICGTMTAKKYEWANIDHKYRRDLEDYIRVCTSCHRKYDIKNNEYSIGFIKN